MIALIFVWWGVRALLSPTKSELNLLTGWLFLPAALMALDAFLWPGLLLLPGGERALAGLWQTKAGN